MINYQIVIDFLFMWIRVCTPILLAALGAAICEKSGVVNLGLEGIMLTAAFFGVIGSAFGGNLFWGLLGGVGSAIAVSALFGYFHLVLKADAVLCGTAINTIAGGLTVFGLQLTTGEKGSSSSLVSAVFPKVSIPILREVPVIGDVLSGHNLLTYLAFLMVILLYIFAYKTPIGLRIRAVGENASAARSVGLNVNRIRFMSILICGALAGLGGMYLSMGYLPLFTRDMVAGRGFIALAANAMGQATPVGNLLASLLFSFFDGLSNVLQMLSLPSEFIQMMPYVATIVFMTVYSVRKIARRNQMLNKDKERANGAE
ncbi:MAG: ABC transporter permease [Clostridiales bacterium]|nr:ABC transporter permease [Clostridiales bacterium]